MANDRITSVGDTARQVSSEVEQVFRNHFGDLSDRVLEELSKLKSAGSTIGGGVGMAALGTVLGGIGFVHLLQKSTGMPLWLCYGISSAMACGAAAGLCAAGAKKVSQVDLSHAGNGHSRKHVLGADW